MRNNQGQCILATKIILFCSLVIALSATSTRANNPGQTLDVAKRFMSNLTSGHFIEATQDFDKTMSLGLPAGQLQTVWESLLAQNGLFKAIGRIRTEAVPGYQLVYVLCQFEHANLDTKIAIDSAGNISGLFFVPATDDWALPTYAEPAAYQESKVMIGSEPWLLPGRLTIPNRPDRKPAVVLVHGSGPQDMDETILANKPFKDLAMGLASRGIAVLRYDKRTKVHPREFNEKIHGFTVNEETVDDAVAAVELLSNRPDIDEHRIYVLGHSLGGNLAPRIARKSGKVSGLIVLAGNTQAFGDSLVEQITYLASLGGSSEASKNEQIAEAKKWRDQINDPDLKPDSQLEILGSRIPGSYWLDLRTYQPVQTALELKLPMLILQGGRDYQVTAKDFDGWKSILDKKPGITLRVYDTLNHLFMTGSDRPGPEDYNQAEHVSETVIQDIADWIKVQKETKY